ncbi:MAG TPA: Hsp20/alpha crystallin family protein [Candidatus Scatomonas merdigallinarum]|nr:Hsp20/alpha crystallin family protein [Candidatus Scatomonas merdigallinarum]
MLLPSIFGEDLFDDMMDFPFEDEFFGRKNPLYGKRAKNLMKTDVKETENGYELDIDLPGFKKEEVQASLENGYLTISASKGLDKDEKDKKGRYIRRERYSGAMSRSFYVGEGVEQKDIHAKFENGILKLTVPKTNAQKVEESKHIAIEG